MNKKSFQNNLKLFLLLLNSILKPLHNKVTNKDFTRAQSKPQKNEPFDAATLAFSLRRQAGRDRSRAGAGRFTSSASP